MEIEAAPAEFIAKWREHWPEWSVAEAFVPEEQREVASAWFALRHELTEATWAGEDPRPGEAKLAWWREELQGWAKGARRHPLGSVLQRQPVPWILLADSIPALFASRGSAPDPDQAAIRLEPFAEGVASVGVTLFADAALPPPSPPPPRRSRASWRSRSRRARSNSSTTNACASRARTAAKRSRSRARCW